MDLVCTMFFFIKIQHITGEILGEQGFQVNEHTVTIFFLNFNLVTTIKKKKFRKLIFTVMIRMFT